ncbi:hypothetical protein KUTeg_002262, partial [Tegillarca granosa]
MSDRIVSIQVKDSQNLPLFIFGVYLPADNCMDTYRLCTLIIAGDFNASCRPLDNGRSNVYKSVDFANFLYNVDLIPINTSDKCNGSSCSYTRTCTMLDYVLTDQVIFEQLKCCEIPVEGTFGNTSDHLPIFVSLDYELKIFKDGTSKHKWPAWHKMDEKVLERYRRSLDEQLGTGLDIRLFWKLINAKRKKTNKVNPEIIVNGEMFTNPEEVAGAFSLYFEQVYERSDGQSFDGDFEQLVENAVDKLRKETIKEDELLPGGLILASEVATQIKTLKR